MNKIRKELEKKQRELQEAINKYNDYDDADTMRTNQLYNACKRIESYIKGLEFALECLEKENE